jgi:methyl-accepting chemotaxis protein
MDKVTQQNAANAEESASASEELSSQAESMNEIVAELTALVGGSTRRLSGTSGTTGRQRRPQRDLSRTDGVLHRIAQQNPKTDDDHAERAIPLSADEQLHHFNA